MGETIRGGYYKGIDGKFRDANGNLVAERSDASIKKETQANKGVTPAGGDTPVPSATDPGPLGPQVPAPPAEASKHAEASDKKEGVRGGKRAKAGKK